MSSVVPPPPPSPVPPAPPPAGTVVVLRPPPALMDLPLGGQFTATVAPGSGSADGAETAATPAARAANAFPAPAPGTHIPVVKGPVGLDTPFGQLRVQTAVPLPDGAALGLRVQALHPQVRLQIVSIDGAPFAPHARPGGTTATGAAAASATGGRTGTAGATAAAGPSVNVGQGRPVTATVLAGNAPSAAAGTGRPAAPGQAAAPASVSRPATTAPSGAGESRPAAATPASGTGSRPAVGASVTEGRGHGPLRPAPPAHATGAGGVRPLPPGTRIPVRLETPAAPTPPPPPGAAARPAAVPGSVPGSVVGATPQGQPLVQTPVGLLALDARSVPPPGTEVRIAFAGAPETPVPVSAPPAEGAAGGRWPVLDEAIQVLREAAPALADQVSRAAVPRPDPPTLTTGALFFIAAVRGGDVRGWLGPTASRVIERERPGLIGRLNDEVASKSGRARDAAGGDWRVALVPMQTDHGIGELQVGVREREPDPEGGPGGGTRFVVDLRLSDMGRVQLDGLARPADKALALIVRTAEALPPPMRRDINALFTGSCEALGLAGQITFQATPRFVELTGVDIAGGDPFGLVV